MKSVSTDWSFRTGCLRSKEIGYILAQLDSFIEKDVTHTISLQWHNGEFSSGDSPILYESACVSCCDKPQRLAISGDGDYWVFGSGDNFTGQIRPKSDMKRKSGPFRRVQAVAGRPYAVGMDRVLFRYDGNKQWSRFDEGMPDGGNLETIAGVDEKLMYAAGWNGDIWWFNGSKSRWQHLAAPVKNHLTCAACADDGVAYIGGHGGALLRCNAPENTCALIEHGVTKGDFWDAAWFNGKLYLSTLYSLYTLEGGKKPTLKQVDFGKEERPATFYHLSAADGILWSIGQKDVISFDGNKWTWIARCDAKEKKK